MLGSMPLRWSALAIASLLTAMLVSQGCAQPSETDESTFCYAGATIFCRCPGGAPGTKVCKSDGSAFGECSDCQPRPSDPGSSSSSSGSSTSSSSSSSSSSGGLGGAGGSGGGGQGGGSTGVEPLLASCDDDGDCQSGMCRHHFCTKPCSWVSECPYPSSECVTYEPGLTICMPTCDTAIDCSAYQAPPSMCGFTKAVDNWDVTVCADWGNDHQLMPPGSDCLPFDHPVCNLGYQHRELVCSAQGVCAVGCYVNSDCLPSESCSTSGSLGTCQ